MGMFLRRSPDKRDPLAVAMSGVRLGERALQVGVDDERLVGQLAAKTGLSGTATCVVPDDHAAARARKGADKVGVHVELLVSPPPHLPLPDGTFDVVVIHSVSGLLSSLEPSLRLELLRESARVLRPGGRLVAIETGEKSGLGALLRPIPASQVSYDRDGGTAASLEQAGFAPVRVLGDREGLKFTEGLRPNQG
ncbi:MAG TPA: methyltransferase domain-containing protein [Vicinamibacteria bacterium]